MTLMSPLVTGVLLRAEGGGAVGCMDAEKREDLPSSSMEGRRIQLGAPGDLETSRMARPLRAHGVPFLSYTDAAPAAAPAEHVLLVDQLVCAHAAFFLGNAPSTVTSTIVQERDKLGLPRNSTDFFGFGPTERADFDSDEWTPTAAFRGDKGLSVLSTVR